MCNDIISLLRAAGRISPQKKKLLTRPRTLPGTWPRSHPPTKSNTVHDHLGSCRAIIHFKSVSTKNEGFFVPADFCARTRLQLNVCCLCILLSEGQFFVQATWKKHATQSDFVAVHFGWQRVSKNTSVAERSRRLNFILVHMICCDAAVDFDLAVKSEKPTTRWIVRTSSSLQASYDACTANLCVRCSFDRLRMLRALPGDGASHSGVRAFLHHLRVVRPRPLEGVYQCPRQSTWRVSVYAAYRQKQHTHLLLVVKGRGVQKRTGHP